MADRSPLSTFLRWLRLSRSDRDAAAEVQTAGRSRTAAVSETGTGVIGDRMVERDRSAMVDESAAQPEEVDPVETTTTTSAAAARGDVERVVSEPARSPDSPDDAAVERVARELEEASQAASDRESASESMQQLQDAARRQAQADAADAEEARAGDDEPDEAEDPAERAADLQDRVDEQEQEALEMRREMLSEQEESSPDADAPAATAAPTVQSAADETVERRVSDARRATDEMELEDAARTKVAAEFDRGSVAEAAADPGGDRGDVEGRPGIDAPLDGTDLLPEELAGSEPGFDAPTGSTSKDLGGIREGVDLLGGMVTGSPGKSAEDLEGAGGGADPRLADGEWSGRSSWTDVMSSDGSQSITGSERYETEKSILEVSTTHEDGVTTQHVRETNKETGEITEETSTDADEDEGGGTEGSDSSGTGTEGSDSTGGEESGSDDETPATTDGTDSTPLPEGSTGRVGQADEAFMEFTEQQRRTAGPNLLGADSLKQPPDDDTSTTDYARSPRQLDEDAMSKRLDPYIQHTEDHVDVPRLAPEDLVFENTLVDPDPDIGVAGIGDLKGPLGGEDPGIDEDDADEMDLDV